MEKAEILHFFCCYYSLLNRNTVNPMSTYGQCHLLTLGKGKVLAQSIGSRKEDSSMF